MPAKLIQEEFENRSNLKHGFEEYDYVESKINGTKRYVWITHNKCKTKFQQTPDAHMSGRGCPKCFGRNKLTQEEFEEKVKKIHGDEYEYLENYKGSNIRIKMKHKICEYEFKQAPIQHIYQKNGCPKCFGTPKSNIIEFLIKIFLKFSQNIVLYGYWKSKYVDNHTKIDIFCYKCQKYFQQTPNCHLSGKGCKSCGRNSMAIKKTFTLDQFLQNLYKKYSQNKILYGHFKSIYKGSKYPMKIFCYKCNAFFDQTPNEQLDGCGCYRCSYSKSEQKINELLTYNNIFFEEQKRFETCKYKNTLPFDFYLIDYNILIEYDGQQHFKPISFGSDQSQETKQKNLEELQFKDNIKTNWAKENNIPLLRISYLEEHLIEEKINKLLKFLKTNII